MNLNTVARDITKEEGKKISVNIAQVKEVLSLFIDYIANYPFEEIAAMLTAHRKEKGKKKKKK